METKESWPSWKIFDIGQKIQSGEYKLSTTFQRNSKSKVWSIFSKIVDEQANEVLGYVYCKKCAKVLKFTNLSTSNLVKHKCYFTKFMHTRNPIPKIGGEKSSTAVSGNENPPNNLSNSFTKWIIKNCRPYELIANEGLKAIFQEFVRLGTKCGSDMDFDKLLPKSQAIVENVMDIYEQCFQTVKAEIAEIKENGFGLTTKIWTDSFSRQSYLALTIHFLKICELKFYLLGFRAMDGENCSSQNISATVQQILEDFDCQLSSKFIIVTDGDDKTTEAFQNCQNLPCITQLLNNAIQNSLEGVPEVAQLISSCIKLVNCIKKKPLDNSLSELFPTYCPSRWNIMYKMLSAIEKNWTEIETTLRNENETAQISSINKTHLKALTKTLQPFEDAIDTLEDTKSPTLHLVILYLHELKKSCDTSEGQNNEFDFIESLKKNLRFYLEKISDENITILHKLALFLYPPTNKLLQFDNKEKQYIESECIRLIKSFKTETQATVQPEPDSPTQPACKRNKLFTDFIESEPNQDPNELIVQEIEFYKNTRVVNSAEFDVFSWWDIQKDNFPLLYKLVCTVLPTPASCGVSRKIFLSAGNLVCEKSDQASNETEVEQIMFISTNSKIDELDRYFSA